MHKNHFIPREEIAKSWQPGGSDLPCWDCRFYDSDTPDYPYGEEYYYCTIGLFIPVKKRTCKKMERHRQNMGGKQ